MKNGRYNTLIQRSGAFIIDGIIFGAAFFILQFFINAGAAATIVSCVSWAYLVYFHAMYGQTPGKMSMKVKVVKSSAEETLIGFEGALKREALPIILTIIDLVLFGDDNQGMIGSLIMWAAWLIAELIAVLSTSKKQAVHDLIAGSVVINIEKPGEWESKYYYGDKSSTD
jgi:uncharacterized RDD family membrane protein YckC